MTTMNRQRAVEVLVALCEGNFDKPGYPSYTDAHQALAALRDEAGEAQYADYDAGLLNDFGGGDVGWWQDYLRAEIGRANEFWRSQVETRPAPQPEGGGLPWMVEGVRVDRPAKPEGGVTETVAELLAKAKSRARVFDDGSDGADAESARSCWALLVAIEAALYAQPAEQPAVAEGFVLVPVEPTEAMLAAFRNRYDNEGDDRADFDQFIAAAKAAAPKENE